MNKPEDFYVTYPNDINDCIDQIAHVDKIVAYWQSLDKIDRAQLALTEPEIIEHIKLACDIQATVDGFMKELEERHNV